MTKFRRYEKLPEEETSGSAPINIHEQYYCSLCGIPCKGEDQIVRVGINLHGAFCNACVKKKDMEFQKYEDVMFRKELNLERERAYKNMPKAKWINVKDRLPKKGEEVLLTWNGELRAPDVIFDYETQTWQAEVITFGETFGWEEVEKPITHWMPYPEIEEPPKN